MTNASGSATYFSNSSQHTRLRNGWVTHMPTAMRPGQAHQHPRILVAYRYDLFIRAATALLAPYTPTCIAVNATSSLLSVVSCLLLQHLTHLRLFVHDVSRPTSSYLDRPSTRCLRMGE